MSIRRLSTNLVNQIAAGEVIERPSSVVKELVENSLDAGATHVQVEIEGGGRLRIAVHDNGSGIPSAELGLALTSHATSKISALDDLLQVGTYGFRGEALASIAAVSRLRLTSKAAGEQTGATVTSEGGEVTEVRPSGRANGTTIDVRDLFFNTPARRKFLRSDATEVGHILETVLRMALAREGVGFTLQTGTRRSLKISPEQSLRQRIAAGYGRQLAESLLPVQARLGALRLSGFLAPPDQAKARSRLQQLYLNDRFIRDRTIQGAIRRAYSDYLAESLQPIYFLFLEMPPQEVDCNVHPTKMEVRLRQSSDVYRFMLSAIDRVLRQSDLAPRVRIPPARPAWGGGPFAAAAAPAPVTPFLPAPGQQGPGATHRPAEQELFEVLSEGPPASSPPQPMVPATGPAPLHIAPGRFVQVLSTYLVTACSEGLLILDQHALHERVLYRHLRAEWNRRKVKRQQLLTPVRVELNPRDVVTLTQSTEILTDVGVEVAPFAANEVAVSAVPACLGLKDVEGLVHRLVTFLQDERPDGRLDDFVDRMLFTMACHRAVRAGDSLREEQIAALLEEAESIEHTHTCPHGRPTRVVVPAAELENLFKRRGF